VIRGLIKVTRCFFPLQIPEGGREEGERGRKREILRTGKGGRKGKERGDECVLFIGTRSSNLYTAVDTPAEAA
jgi:hypothetical protein